MNAPAGLRPVVVLIGPPGSGKSSVAARLGERLGLDVLDTDEVLAQRAGMSIGEYFVDVGEAAFHTAEAKVVARAFAGAGGPGVVALGSGAVEGATERLRSYAAAGGIVVFLDVSLSAGVPRVGLNAPRSARVGNVRAQLAVLAAARRPVYLGCATMTIDTSDASVDEVTDQVLAALGS